jgi:RalA-binding protein 1
MVSRPLDEEPVFTLSVISRSQISELWRVEKVIGALPTLDQKIRQTSSLASKLPDRSIFNGHSPAKVDSRRAALNAYFDSLLDTPMDEKAAMAVCQFLTNDAIEPRDDETNLLKGPGPAKSDMPRGPDESPQKEGYLTKRGKNFGGWKARYFVLDGPELRYFESPGGPHMGTIKLHHAQIGKQSPKSSDQQPSNSADDDDNQYRHAFLVLEPKKKDSSALVRHVLCAESDEERDAWVDALMDYVESASSESEGRSSVSKSQIQHQDHNQAQGKQSPADSQSKMFNNGGSKPGRRVDSPDIDPGNSVQGFSFDDAVQAEPPTIGSTLEQAPRSPRIPAALSTELRDMTMSSPDQPLQSPRLISGPTNGSVIQDVEAWGNKAKTSTKEKKRSIWGFRTRSSFDLAAQAQASSDTLVATSNVQAERKGPVRPVFGIPLAEAVQDCAPPGIDVELPAVVYRCIEYLHAKEAALEEGIFRLSGSNVVIKALKERFNTEGDVDFVSGDQYYDVHAVASLFKQYLRELPTTVLTRELHLDFLRVLGMRPTYSFCRNIANCIRT